LSPGTSISASILGTGSTLFGNIINPTSIGLLHVENVPPLETAELERVRKEVLHDLKIHYQAYQEIYSVFGNQLFHVEDIELNLIKISDDEEEDENVLSESGNSDSFASIERNLLAQLDKIEKEDTLSTEHCDDVNISKNKHTFVVENFFKLSKKVTEVQERILIQGEAGVGKTTFSNYLTYYWAIDKLWQDRFEWIFKITLRNLTLQIYQQPNKIYNIQDIIYHECFPSLKRNHFDQLWLEGIKPSKRVLIILDGVDEISSITVDKEHKLNNAMTQLLESSWPSLYTSRPYGLEALPKKRKIFKISGFTDKNIQFYIQEFFKKMKFAEEQGQILFRYLRATPVLWEMAHSPVLLNILCGISEEEYYLKKHFTLTELYRAMEQRLLERAYIAVNKQSQQMIVQERLNKSYQYYKDTLLFFDYVAFYGMQQEEPAILQPDWMQKGLQTVVGDSIDKKITLFDTAKILGFIKPIQISADASKSERDKSQEFMHFSFQEYFAARYIADRINLPEVVEVVQKHKFNPRYQLVWGFVAGLLKDSSNFKIYLTLMQESETKDLFGQYQLGLEARILEESYCPKTAEMLKEINGKMEPELFNLYRQFRRGQYKQSPFISFLQLCPNILRGLGEVDLMTCILEIESIPHTFEFISETGIMTPKTVDFLIERLGIRLTYIPSFEVIKRINIAANDARITSTLFNMLKNEDKSSPTFDMNAAYKKPILYILEKVAGTTVLFSELTKELLMLLKNKNKGDAETAKTLIEKICSMGVTPPLLKGLLSLLEDNESEIRENAKEVIKDLGSHVITVKFVEGLLKLLKNEKHEVRRHAAHTADALGLSVVTAEFMQGLLALLTEENLKFYYVVSWILEQLGPRAGIATFVKGLVPLLDSPNQDVRFHTIIAIKHLGAALLMHDLETTEKILQKLLVALGNEETCIDAVKALRNMGPTMLTNSYPTSLKILKKLFELVGNASAPPHKHLIMAIGELGPTAFLNYKDKIKIIFKGLISLLKDEDKDTIYRMKTIDGRGVYEDVHKSDAKWAAKIIGDLRSIITPQLLKDLLLVDNYNVLVALGNIGPTALQKDEEVATSIIKFLLHSLESRHEDFQRRVVVTARLLGPSAATPIFLQGLLKLLENSHSKEKTNQRLYASVIICTLFSEEIKPRHLLELFNKGFVSDALLYIVARLAKFIATEDFLRKLLILFKNENTDIRVHSILAIRALSIVIQQNCPEMILGIQEDLLRLCQDKEEKSAICALETMGDFGYSKNPKVLDCLLSALKEGNESFRVAASKAIEKNSQAIACFPQEMVVKTIRILLSVLEDKNFNISWEAKKALETLARFAKDSELLLYIFSLISDTSKEIRGRIYLIKRANEMGASAENAQFLSILFSFLMDSDKDANLAAIGILESSHVLINQEQLNRVVSFLREKKFNIKSAPGSLLTQLGEQYFKEMFEIWLTTSQNDSLGESLIYLSQITLAGYLGCQVRMQILENTTTLYSCRIFIGKTAFLYELTPFQRYSLSSLVPQILENWKAKGELISSDKLRSLYLNIKSSISVVHSSGSAFLLPAYTQHTAKINAVFTKNQSAFENDPQCQQLVSALREVKQSFMLESLGHNQLTITVGAEAVSSEIGLKWLKQCSELLERYGSAYLVSSEPFKMESDELFYLLTITTKSLHHRDKLKDFLKPSALLQKSPYSAALS
jgi:HEAT repeat protein